MRKHILFTSLFLLLTIILVVYFTFYSKDNIIERKEINNYLFNTSNFEIKQRCYEDLIGLSMDGSFYDFYKYEVFNINSSNLMGEYPKFDSIFNVELNNADFSYWNKTPIENNGLQYHFDIAFSSNLGKSKCSMKFQEQDYLRRPNNYYSFISIYPIGVYLFIFSPSTNELFVIAKKG